MKETKVAKTLKKLFATDDVFWKNEVEANILLANVLLLTGIFCLATWVLTQVGIFEIDEKVMDSIMIQVAFETMVPVIISVIFKGSKKWIKYLFIIGFILINARMDSIFGFNSPLLMVVPVIIACRYYSVALTVQVIVLSVILFAGSSFFGAYFGIAAVDLNFYPVPEGTSITVIDSLYNTVRNIEADRLSYAIYVMLQSFLPKLMSYSVISFICIKISQRGRIMVLDQAEVVKKTARLESELSVAKNIQRSMLPSKFPAFPERNDFDVYANMRPAKEVGGDFYDFFLIDENHLGIVISDVSGKGVPAALFMVNARTLIKNLALTGKAPEDVFTRVNNLLLEGNDAMLFVTSFMGVVDLKTGVMQYVNAGHNPPLVVKNTGDVSYLKTKPQLVLAGIEDIPYMQHEMQLSKGDRLVLYTDGVTEACNEDLTLYGEDRLLAFTKARTDASVKDYTDALYEELDQYAGKQDQQDDITVLTFQYEGPESEVKESEESSTKWKEFKASDDELSAISDYVSMYLEEKACDMSFSFKVQLAIEEVFVNISHYAYENETVEENKKVRFGISETNGLFTFIFEDQGIEFNPLDRPEVDISAQETSDKVGGLGIFIVKKNMDTVDYEYKDGKNVLTLKVQK